MKYAFISIALAAMLALGACSATNVDEKIGQVQDTATQLCRFVPTVETVAKILASFAGRIETVDLVGTAAKGICEAVETAPLAEGPGERAPEFRDVKIEGRFK